MRDLLTGQVSLATYLTAIPDIAERFATCAQVCDISKSLRLSTMAPNPETVDWHLELYGIGAESAKKGSLHKV